MHFCKNCGIEISKDQEENFNNLCPDCIRLVKYGKRKGGACYLFVGCIFLLPSISLLLTLLPSLDYIDSFELSLYIGSFLILLSISILLIYFGIKRRREFKYK